MANKPLSNNLPADLPENWQQHQTVAPNGTDVGLTQQHGYNYQSKQINDVQKGVNAINAAFANFNADTADKLTTARTIAITGKISGSGSFNGAANLSIAGTDNSGRAAAPVNDFNVANSLRWLNFGAGHVIVDNSSGAYPGGNANSSVPWSASYPVLMGYNGTSTFGVRVDSARYADEVANMRINSSTGVFEYFNHVKGRWESVSQTCVKSVQRGIVDASSSTVITVSSVNVNKAFINLPTILLISPAVGCTFTLTGPTSITVTSNLSAGVSKTVSWELIEYY